MDRPPGGSGFPGFLLKRVLADAAKALSLGRALIEAGQIEEAAKNESPIGLAQTGLHDEAPRSTFCFVSRRRDASAGLALLRRMSLFS
ncbi:MAG TPA: hypothetical protein VKA61_03305 [Sphingomicrobium sp.]|nr:hypothetical protein [Sphingomicrobium sp.]